MPITMSPIDALEAGEAIPTARAAELLHVHPASLWRWSRKGRKFPDGVRRYLSCMRIGKEVLYLRPDLDEWIVWMSMSLRQRKPVTPKKAGAKKATQKILEKAGIRKPNSKR